MSPLLSLVAYHSTQTCQCVEIPNFDRGDQNVPMSLTAWIRVGRHQSVVSCYKAVPTRRPGQRRERPRDYWPVVDGICETSSLYPEQSRSARTRHRRAIIRCRCVAVTSTGPAQIQWGCTKLAQPRDDASQNVYSALRRRSQPTRPVPIMPSTIAPGAGIAAPENSRSSYAIPAAGPMNRASNRQMPAALIDNCSYG